MLQRKVSILLLLFSRDDLNEFHNFLLNPAISSGKTLALFLDQFRKKVLLIQEGEDCTVEELLKGTDINPRRMDKLCSRLYGLARQFLAQQEFLKNDQLQMELLAKAIEEREPGSKEAERLYERIGQQLKNSDESAENLLNSLKIRWLRAEVAIKSRDTRALWQEDFQDLHHLLDKYYHLQKLRLLSASRNARNVYNQPLSDPNTLFPLASDDDPIAIGLDDMNDGPLSHAFILAIRMFQSSPDADHFPRLLDLLQTNAPRFAPKEGMELYGYALNFCILNINMGRWEYLEHASALYIQLLENKLILEKGELAPTQFKNIVALHCRLGKLDWVAEFIESHTAFLPQESRAFAVMYNRAVLAFYQKKYDWAIRQFRETVNSLTDDVFYGLDARVYLWKSYFEHYEHLTLDEVDEMYRLYDAFRLFIERNEKISPAHKLNYRHFTRAFKRFMEILRVQPVRKDHLQALRTDVEKTEAISNKGWMLAKIDLTLAK
jgi:hypothetical protein